VARRADHSTNSGRSAVAAAQEAELAQEVDFAAAAEVAPEADVAADGDGDRRMAMAILKSWTWKALAATLLLAAAQVSSASAAQTNQIQRSFASPEEAVTAFVAALRTHNEADLRAVLGPGADRVIDSGDRYADRELHNQFVALFDQNHTIDRTTSGRAELDVGPDNWPLPIPIVESAGRWTFDTKAGGRIIIERRIGRNELSAIRTLLTAVDAQHDFFDRVKQATGTGEFATHFLSTAGHQDGLYWPVAEGETESPLGPLIDAAQDAGYPGKLVHGKPIPYEGYYFRILQAQGPYGDGGAKSFVHDGRLTGGFALIAWPAVFGSSGIMTFIAGPDGDVYQKDLGPQTGRIASEMKIFDPDLSWSHVDVTND
jgi:hypothetical protein